MSHHCPTCQDRGWIEAPYYGDFEPTTKPTPCPDCPPAKGEGGIGCLFTTLAACFFVWLMWGAR